MIRILLALVLIALVGGAGWLALNDDLRPAQETVRQPIVTGTAR